MSQSQVSEFFSKRKRNDAVQPSKRRKAVISSDLSTETTAPIPTKTPPVGARTRSRISSKVTHPVAPVTSKTRSTRASRSSKAKAQIPVIPDNQQTIKNVFSNLQTKAETKGDLAALIESIPTAASDNHNASPPGTPTKMKLKTPDDDSSVTTKKRSRLQKNVVRDLFKEETEDPGFTMPQPSSSESSDRKVISPRRLSTEEKPKVFEFTGVEDTKQKAVKDIRIKHLAKEAFTPAPQESPSTSVETPASSRSKSTINKAEIKEIETKMKSNPAALKAKLSQCGKLAELKQKLLEMNKQQSPRKKSLAESVALSPSKTRLLDVIKNSPIKAAAYSPSKLRSDKAPAYERFSHLAEPVPPGLTLPKHYKLLDDFFTSADTVVSMLHKRAEVCTFSKLKKAIQEMTRKNFEESDLGRIKTVYPSAYLFKQEKNLSSYGKKLPGYQLTVEANLTDDPWSQNAPIMKTKDGRPDFTAAKILERKNIFHRKLFDLTMKAHKEFLDNLERPLSIPEKKITKWHPAFRVDSVAHVEADDLPKPPNVEVITTARDALEQARNKPTNPRVLNALETVVAQNTAENIIKGKTEAVKANTQPKPSPKKSNSETSATAVKGVSQSLLDRIRAKEAQKQEESMYQKPADVKKKERMGRLPELARVLRGFFVTQKKPALPLEDVIQKFTDSYSSSLGLSEAEQHLTLMSELVPEWVSVVKIKRGSFVKIDRNKDVNAVISNLEKLHKKAV